LKELYHPEDGRVKDEATSTPVMAGRLMTLGPGVMSLVARKSMMVVTAREGVRSTGGMPDSLDNSLAVLGLLWQPRDIRRAV